MREVEVKQVPSMFTVGEIIKGGLGDGVHGVGVVHTPSAEVLGTPVRSDDPKRILAEGVRMGAVDSIMVCPDERVTAEVFSTIAGSSHTVYGVPYQQAEECWDRQLEKHAEYTRDKSAHFVAGTQDDHAKYIPTQLITWIMMKVKTGDNPDDFIMAPIDIYQIAEAQHNGSREIQIPSSDISEPGKKQTILLNEDAFAKIYESVEKHICLHSEYLRDMYNAHVRPKLNEQLTNIGIELGEKEIVDIATTMALGYFRDKKALTGMGGGPQSNRFAHIHSTAYPDLDLLRELIVAKVFQQPQRESDLVEASQAPNFDPHLIYKIARLMSIPDITDEEILERLGPEVRNQIGSITHWLETQGGWFAGAHETNEDAVRCAIVEKAQEVSNTITRFEEAFNQGVPVLGKLTFEDPTTFSPGLAFKQIDPYATIFHELMDGCITEMLSDTFKPLGVTTDQVQSFIYHTEPHRLDMRMAEGWSVEVSNADFSHLNEKLNAFLHNINTMWKDGYSAWKLWYTRKDESGLAALRDQFNLSDVAVATIKRIIPTDQQLQDWKGDGSLSDTDKARLSKRLERRRSPAFRERARKIMEEDGLAHRARAFGLFQVLEGTVFLQGSDGTPEQTFFNKGFNIPGVPGFGIKYQELQGGGWKVTVHPLLSEKAMAEVEAGYAVVRTQAKETQPAP